MPYHNEDNGQLMWAMNVIIFLITNHINTKVFIFMALYGNDNYNYYYFIHFNLTNFIITILFIIIFLIILFMFLFHGFNDQYCVDFIIFSYFVNNDK
jgi:uncharacterized membrane protein